MSHSAYFAVQMDDAETVEEYEDDSDGWEECDDIDAQLQNVICLFCTDTFSNPESAFVHCHEVHRFSIIDMKRLHSLDCIAYIKLVNFVRRNAS